MKYEETRIYILERLRIGRVSRTYAAKPDCCNSTLFLIHKNKILCLLNGVTGRLEGQFLPVTSHDVAFWAYRYYV